MLVAAYLEMFHGSILLNCQLRGCNKHENVPTPAHSLFGTWRNMCGQLVSNSEVSKQVFLFHLGEHYCIW